LIQGDFRAMNAGAFRLTEPTIVAISIAVGRDYRLAKEKILSRQVKIQRVTPSDLMVLPPKTTTDRKANKKSIICQHLIWNPAEYQRR
jgi:hypothetical protein